MAGFLRSYRTAVYLRANTMAGCLRAYSTAACFNANNMVGCLKAYRTVGCLRVHKIRPLRGCEGPVPYLGDLVLSDPHCVLFLTVAHTMYSVHCIV